VASAEVHNGIDFRVARAEDSGLESNAVDLVTVAQALHWFDIDAFFAEAGRVLKPGGVLAFWCYHNYTVDPACDEVIGAIFDSVDDYWPAETEIVDNCYRDITMPFTEMPVDKLSMTTEWTVDEALDYMRTWSASQRYIAENGVDPVAAHAAELKRQWGEGTRPVNWPLILRVGQN
jgi:SAM-dependent methyltransferase